LVHLERGGQWMMSVDPDPLQAAIAIKYKGFVWSEQESGSPIHV
jgi:hypothetical protein